MILINVLPPEMRKRDSGVSPVFAAVVVGALLVLGLATVYTYVHWFRIPYAEERLAEAEDLLRQKEAQKALVLQDQQKIAAAIKRRDALFDLLGKKVYMARSLNDYVSFLTATTFSQEGFSVSVTDLRVEPKTSDNRRGRSRIKTQGPELQEIEWRWGMRIVGESFEMSGDYLKSFFHDVANSAFWSDNRFVGHPSDSYAGDAPIYLEDIDRVAVDCELQWTRVVPPVTFVAIDSSGDAPQPARKGR